MNGTFKMSRTLTTKKVFVLKLDISDVSDVAETFVKQSHNLYDKKIRSFNAVTFYY